MILPTVLPPEVGSRHWDDSRRDFHVGCCLFPPGEVKESTMIEKWPSLRARAAHCDKRKDQPNEIIARRVRTLNRSAAAVLLLMFLLAGFYPILIQRTAAIFLSATLGLAYFSLRTKVGRANVCLFLLTLLLYGLYVSAQQRAGLYLGS